VPTKPTYPFHLKREREKADITQQALADKAGIGQSHLALLESGARKPSWDAANRIADALGVGLDRLRGKS
jgi:transcriptional regulator with XRE-family HTH domain